MSHACSNLFTEVPSISMQYLSLIIHPGRDT